MSLHLRAISYQYPGAGLSALSAIDASFTQPLVAILGPNGAGKSTLLKILCTQVLPSSGQVYLDDEEVRGPTLARYRQHLGWMPQRLGILGGYTCEEFLRYVAWMRRVPLGKVEGLLTDALAVVNLESQANKQVKNLSGGMRQRLSLAQAIIAKPKVLLLDEPTVGLDPRERAEFRQFLRDLTSTCQVVISTHLVDDVASIAQQVLVLDRGRPVFSGTLAEFCPNSAGPASAEDVERAYLHLVPSSSN